MQRHPAPVRPVRELRASHSRLQGYMYMCSSWEEELVGSGEIFAKGGGGK